MGILLRITLLVLTLRRVFIGLETSAGKDWRAAIMGSAAGVPANFVGLTANVTPPAVGDTTLAGEIATAGGGLIRKQATYAHTAGTSSYTLTTTFTANGSDVLPVTIGKRGVFTAVTVGTLAYEALVSPTATLSASGDQLTLTDTFNI